MEVTALSVNDKQTRKEALLRSIVLELFAETKELEGGVKYAQPKIVISEPNARVAQTR
jgi:hypothetical protein